MCDSNTNQNPFVSNKITLAIAIAPSVVTIVCLIVKCCCNSINGPLNEECDLEELSRAEDKQNANRKSRKRLSKRKVRPFRLERHYRLHTSLNLKQEEAMRKIIHLKLNETINLEKGYR